MEQNASLKRGIVINFIAKYTNVLFSLVITFILARLLSPKDFGVIAVVTVFITFFSVLSDMGISGSVIQKKDLSSRDISNLFYFTLFLGLGLGLVFYLFAGAIAAFYNNQAYILITRLLAIVVLFSTLNTIPNAILLKQKRFASIGLCNVCASLLSGGVAIFAAFRGANYYALIIQSILNTTILFAAGFRLSKIHLYKNADFSIIREIFAFSSFQFLFNIINYFARNLDNILISKSMGVRNLGYYNQAYKLMLYPLQYLTFVVSPVLQPMLSDYQHDVHMIFTQYTKVVRILAVIGFYASCVCFVCSKEIILILYGAKWIESVQIFQILSLSIGVQVVLSSSGAIFLAANNSKYLFYSGSLAAVIVVTGILFGVFQNSLKLVAAGIVCGYLINFFISYITLIKFVLHSSLRKFFRIVAIPIGASVLSSGIALVIPFHFSSVIVSFLVKFIFCSALYGTVLWKTGEGRVVLQLVLPQSLKKRIFVC